MKSRQNDPHLIQMRVFLCHNPDGREAFGILPLTYLETYIRVQGIVTK